MKKISVGVRDVDKYVFIEFKAMAVERGIKLGYALTKAMRKLLDQHRIEEGEN